MIVRRFHYQPDKLAANSLLELMRNVIHSMIEGFMVRITYFYM